MKRSGISGGLFYDLVCWSMDAWHTSSAPHACSVPGSSHSGLCSTLPSFATSIGVDFVSRESPLNFYSRLTHAFSRVWISTSPSPHLWKQRQQRGGALTSEASTRTQDSDTSPVAQVGRLWKRRAAARALARSRSSRQRLIQGRCWHLRAPSRRPSLPVGDSESELGKHTGRH